jgi:hypothetical protein
MADTALNIFGPAEIARLKTAFNEAVQQLPKQDRSCAIQASLAEQLLKIAAGGETDPIRLKQRALDNLQRGLSS